MLRQEQHRPHSPVIGLVSMSCVSPSLGCSYDVPQPASIGTIPINENQGIVGAGWKRGVGRAGVGRVNADMVPYGRNDADRTVARFQAPALSGAIGASLRQRRSQGK